MGLLRAIKHAATNNNATDSEMPPDDATERPRDNRKGKPRQLRPAKSKADARPDPKLFSQAQRWDQFADSTEYMLAIYQSGDDIIVNVLRVNYAEVHPPIVRLYCEAPIRRKDRHLGEHLEFDRPVEFSLPKLKYSEPLPGFGDDFETEVQQYQTFVERGLVIAKKKFGVGPGFIVSTARKLLGLSESLCLIAINTLN